MIAIQFGNSNVKRRHQLLGARLKTNAADVFRVAFDRSDSIGTVLAKLFLRRGLMGLSQKRPPAKFLSHCRQAHSRVANLDLQNGIEHPPLSHPQRSTLL